MNDDTTKKQLFALMAHAEEQQKALDKALELVYEQQQHLENIQNNLPELAVKLFKDSLNDARASIDSDLDNHATLASKELKKASRDAMRASEAIKYKSKALGWKHAFMVIGGIFLACLALVIGTTLWIPSLDEIKERRATVEALNNEEQQIQKAKCNGQLCVRVMTKQCGYGKTKDYCVADLKD